MAKTLISSTTLFLPVAEFINRCDTRTVAQLASDNNTPVATASLASNDNVLAAIKDACGLLESAAYCGDKYQNEDLELIAATDCHARNLMYRIITGMAEMLLLERRPDLRKEPTQGMLRATQWLEELWNGKKIFPFQEVADAGHLDHEVENAADVVARKLPSYTARLLFGTRNNRAYDPE